MPSTICVRGRTSRRSEARPEAPIRDTSSAPAPTSTACVANGSARPSANRPAPIGGPTSWLAVIWPTISRALPMPRSADCHHHRQQRVGRRVRERLGGAEDEHRAEHDPHVHRTGDDHQREHEEDQRPDEVDGDDDQPAVDAVGHDTRRATRTATRAPAAGTQPRRRARHRRSATRRAAARRRARSRRRGC